MSQAYIPSRARKAKTGVKKSHMTAKGSKATKVANKTVKIAMKMPAKLKLKMPKAVKERKPKKVKGGLGYDLTKEEGLKILKQNLLIKILILHLIKNITIK